MRKILPFSSIPGKGISNKLLKTASMLFVVVFLFVGYVSAQQLSQNAQRQIKSLQDEKAARTPAQKKIGSNILYEYKIQKGQSLTPEVATLKTGVVKDANGRIKVDIDATITPALLNTLKTLGCQVIFSSEKFNSITANIPLDKVEEIAAIDAVKHIKYWMAPRHGSTLTGDPGNNKILTGFPGGINIPVRKTEEPTFNIKYQPDFTNRASNVRQQLGSALDKMKFAGNGFFAGTVNSEGDAAHKADLARLMFGANGSGVKVGVLSDSYNSTGGAASDVTTGNLPGPGNPDGFLTPVTVLEDISSGSDEGRAMLQIVHDLAPGAQLYFATAFVSEADFAQQILNLRAAGCDIIVDDVGYFDEGVFQDGIVAQAVNSVTASGALYFSSAGNSGNKDDTTSGTWEGDFKDGGALSLFPNNTVHDFGGGVLFNSLASSSDLITLKWSDPLGASHNDYDFYITNATGTSVLAASTDIQNGDDDPYELFNANFSTGMEIYIVKKEDALPRALHLETNRGLLTIGTEGVTSGHNCAVNAFCVAATPAAASDNAPTGPYPNPFTSANKVENFSSDGPRRIFYNPDGTEITPGNVLFGTGGGKLLQKPDITAADGVSTTLPGTSGLNPFFGTSAAAPHAGAIAALIKSKLPSLTPTQIRAVLISSAIDIEGPGVDRDAGAGIVMAYEALVAAGATQCNLPTITAPTVTQTGCPAPNTGTIVVNATGSGTILYSLNGGPYQSSNTFDGLPPGLYNITARIGDQDAGCIATYSGNPVIINPANTSTATFSYAGATVPIPDGNATGVNIPLTVAGAGALISNLNFRLDGSTCSAAQGSATVGLTHSWVGDLMITLTSPSGTTVTLMNRPGGINNSGNNFCNTVLDDAASNSIQNIAIAGAPWQGTFKPASPLSAFDGEDPNGVWILHVVDNVTIDAGTVNHFSLVISSQAACPDAPSLLTSTVTGNIEVCAGAPSTSPNLQRFSITGSLLTGPVNVFVPGTNFEISTNPTSGFGSVINLNPVGGTLPSTIIYVRTTAGAIPGSLSEYVNIGTTGLTPIKVLVKATVTGVATITAPTVTQILCGSNDGSIVINATGPGPLEYSINGGSSWSSSNTFNNLDAGAYNVAARVSGANPSCFSIYSGNPITINPGVSTISFNTAPTVIQPICPEPIKGTIIVNATATAGALEYSLNGGPYQSSNTFSGLNPGNYNITARLAASHTCTLAYPGNPVVISVAASTVSFTAVNVTQPLCTGTVTGTIVVNATGAGPLEYSIGGTWQSSNVFAGLIPGSYSIVARLQSSHTCVSSYSGNPIFINPPSSTVVFTAPTVTQPACPSPQKGVIVVNATGAGPLEYSLNGGPFQASNTFSGLAGGNYFITARVIGSGAEPACTATYSGNPVTINVLNESLPIAIDYTGGVVAIPDGNETGVNIPLTVTGVGSILADLNFRFNGSTCTATQGATTVGLSHSWVGDLTITLTSPGGTTDTLMDRPGGINNSGNNFCNTILDDNASNLIQNIAITGAPWTGSFRPARPLSAFNGEDPNGTWILHVVDHVTIDAGQVRAFSLVLTTTTPCPAVPTINADAASGTITACAGNASVSPAVQQFPVSGTDLSADITVTAPTNFEVSTDPNTGYSSSLTLTQTGGVVPNTIIYVRSSASALPGPISGVVTLVSNTVHTGVTVSGTINPIPDVVGTPLFQTLNCGAGTITTIALSGSVSGTAFNWIRDNTTTVTGIAGNGSGNISGSLVNTTTDPITVTFTITPTANGCDGAAITATVTINPDVTAPVAPTSLPDIHAECSVNLSPPSALDNCAGPIIGTTTTASPVTTQGTTIVVWTFNDGHGNTSSVNQNIIIQDVTPPTITCPANITVNNTTGQCGANVTFAAIAGDNCSVVTVTYDHAPGSFFPTGTTTVIATAHDAVGLTASCSFTVKVIDAQAPVITCPSNITQAISGNSCSKSIAVPNPSVSDNCGIAKLTWIMTGATTGSSSSTGTNYVGTKTFNVGTTTITYTATDINGNTNQCSFTVRVTESVLPTIGCPANKTVAADYGFCSWNSKNLTTPTVSDNCGIASVTNNAPALLPLGATVVTWTVTDNSGNTRTCSQTITVVDNQPPSVTSPANIYMDASSSCVTSVTAPNATYYDNCTVAKLTWVMTGATTGSSPSTGINFVGTKNYNVGTTTITYTIKDASGNSSSSSFAVIITDRTKPSLTCPANITQTASNGSCGRSIAVPDPVYSDNCGVTKLTWYMTGATSTSSSMNGINKIGTKTFNVGLTTITYSIWDAAGNTESCTFTVRVTDSQNPVVSCPSARTLCKVNNNYYSIPTITESDNCGIATTTYKVTGATTRNGTGTNASGTFNLGLSTITWTVTDFNGNVTTCSTNVTVVTAGNCSQVKIATPTDPKEALKRKLDIVVEDAKLNIVAYPNPAESYFNVRITGGSKETVEIGMYDMNGKLVQMERGASDQTYRFGDKVTGGMYMIQVRQGGQIATTRVVKL